VRDGGDGRGGGDDARQDLVARGETERLERQVEAGPAGADSYRVTGADEGGEAGLELDGARPEAQRAGRERGVDLVDLSLIDPRPSQRQDRRSDGTPTLVVSVR
jgi:hypothetical protein